MDGAWEPGSLDAPVYAEFWLPITSSAPQPDRDAVKSIVYDLAFRPDGTQIVAAVGNRVLVYDAADGDLLHSLKGELQPPFRSFAPVIQPTCLQGTRPQCTPWHTLATENASPPAGSAPKFNVWLAQSLRMAAMRRDCWFRSADKTIIIWKSNAEGILKYSHNDTVQCLSYNPVTQQLASATATDFGTAASFSQQLFAARPVSVAHLCAVLWLTTAVASCRAGWPGTRVHLHTCWVQSLRESVCTVRPGQARHWCHCGVSGTGLWSPEQKSVAKHKLNAKALCARHGPAQHAELQVAQPPQSLQIASA
jgi:hypothetical protein